MVLFPYFHLMACKILKILLHAMLQTLRFCLSFLKALHCLYLLHQAITNMNNSSRIVIAKIIILKVRVQFNLSKIICEFSLTKITFKLTLYDGHHTDKKENIYSRLAKMTFKVISFTVLSY